MGSGPGGGTQADGGMASSAAARRGRVFAHGAVGRGVGSCTTGLGRISKVIVGRGTATLASSLTRSIQNVMCVGGLF